MNIRNIKSLRPPKRPPAALPGLLAVFAIVSGIFVFELTRGRGADSSATLDGPSQRLLRQTREIEALQLRVAVLSGRLASAEGCAALPVEVPVEKCGSLPIFAAATSADPDDPSDDPSDGGSPPDAATGKTSAGPDATAPGADLSTALATETFLRDLARNSASLSVDEAVCSDEVCRLTISGRGVPDVDAMALQSFVGLTTERLAKTLIQPGAAGTATVVLLARPGHDLPNATNPASPTTTVAATPVN